MMKKIIPVLVLLVTLYGHQAAGQSAEDIRKKYPGESVVLLNHSMHYDISVVGGAPKVESSDKQELLFLSTDQRAYTSQYGFSHSAFHELKQYEAYTLSPSSKKIKVTEFKTSDSKHRSVFYDDVKETVFDFPAVAPGAIGALQVSMAHKEPHLLSPFYFTRRIPVVKSELTISFPKDMTVKYILKGNDKDKVQLTQQSQRSTNTYTFTFKDQPAERSYEDAPDDDWYSTHVIFYIERYKDETGKIIPYLSGIDDLYQLDRSYLANINGSAGPELKHIVDSLTANVKDSEEKTRRIYGWVQGNIKYIAFEEGMEGFIPRDANLVCSRRFGDCKDMSSILTLMLRTAGIPAYYTWIGTRDLPYTYEETPLPLVDNHMICTVRTKDGYTFLDGTDPSCIFGLPSQGIQGKEALVALDDSSYKILTVPVVDKDINQLVDSTTLDLSEKDLHGTITTHLSGYYSMNMHNSLYWRRDKDLEDYMKGWFYRGSNKFRLDSFRIGDRNDKAHLNLKGQFTLPDYAKHIADEWYINLNLFKFYEHEEIDYPTRRQPIEMHFKNRRKYVTTLKIPAGYSISYLPSGKSFHNDVWGFDISYQQKGDQLILTQEFDNEHLLLTPAQFEAWNKVLENLYPLYKETVSLAKK